MAGYTQEKRPMAIEKSPLGPDKLLLVALNGSEGLSSLFHFQLDLLAENTSDVAFDKLLGQPIAVRLDVQPGKPRFINGICSRVSQGASDAVFTAYRVEVVPKLWLLTKRAQSRIFQQKSVPDILKEVLEGLDVSFQLQGTFHPRDYCVQYRETDFNFASRLMEEEGIYYFFKHTKDSHQMVVANTPQSHPDVPEQSTILFHENPLGGHETDPGRIHQWTKSQELRSGKFTLWDHCFELPHKHLEADKPILDSVPAGQVTHKLTTGGNASLEIYDWPGEYAQRFDGVDPGGGDRPADLQKIFEDNKRTVEIRMQQEAAGAVVIEGAGSCRQLAAGHKFTLKTGEGGETAKCLKADGSYVLTAISHSATQSDYRSDDADFRYANTFSCIPAALPYRPARATFKPVVEGTQTAVVVGPAGEEIFTDKYGRVKVQFHWDREGKKDAGSSCWVRVAQLWAGKQWGAFFWPRIGQEVVVAFEEGDPDQPIIIGSVYNAEQMPPYLGNGPDDQHPNDNKVSGIKTNTTPGGQGYNELRFDDTKDKQQVFIHAERNMDVRVKNDSLERIFGSRYQIIGWEKDGKKGGDQRETIYQDKHLNIKRHQVEHIEGNYELQIGGGDEGPGNLDLVIGNNRTEKIGKDEALTVGGAQAISIGKDHSLTIGGSHQESVGKDFNLETTKSVHINAGTTLVLEAGNSITIKVGSASLVMKKDGSVSIDGKRITLKGDGPVAIKGAQTLLNCVAVPTPPDSLPAANCEKPQEAKKAQPAKADEADNAKTGAKSAT